MDIDFVARKMGFDVYGLRDEIIKVAKFYNMEDLNLEEQLFLFVLARVRDLNTDEFNMYKTKSHARVFDGVKDSTDIPYDEKFYENLFNYLDDRGLRHTV